MIHPIIRKDVVCSVCGARDMTDMNPHFFCNVCKTPAPWRPMKETKRAIVSVPGANGESDLAIVGSVSRENKDSIHPLAEIRATPEETLPIPQIEDKPEEFGHVDGECSFCKQSTLVIKPLGVHCNTCGKNEAR